MPKSARPSRRRHANTLQTRARGNLVDRLLDLPQLARVIPQLQPELVHQIVQHCGLEDCAELVALVPQRSWSVSSTSTCGAVQLQARTSTSMPPASVSGLRFSSTPGRKPRRTDCRK